jgi:cell wall-associated NlpC family hydrolase
VADQIQAHIDSLTVAVQEADRQQQQAKAAADAADSQARAATKAFEAAGKKAKAASDRLAGDAVLAYVQGGDPANTADLGPSDSEMSSRTYLGSLLAQHQRELKDAKAQLKAADAKRAASITAAATAHQHASDTAAAAKARHDQVADLNGQLLLAVQRLNSADAGSRPLTLEEIAALLQSYDSRFAGDGTVPPATQRANEAVKYALAQVGKPYVWGGNGPNYYDCSGLTQQSWLHGGGVVIPRVASDQQAWTIPIPASAAQPGDLVFFGLPAYHVGMYLGNGMMVDAPHQGAYVRIEPIWRSSFSGFGRVP